MGNIFSVRRLAAVWALGAVWIFAAGAGEGDAAADSYGASGGHRRPRFAVENGVGFLLEARRDEFVDATGRHAAGLAVGGGEIVDDPVFGRVLRFPPDAPANSGIAVADDGGIDLSDGFAVEAWVFLEEPLEEKNSFTFARKLAKEWRERTFDTSVVAGHALTLHSLALRGEHIEPPESTHRTPPTLPRAQYPGTTNTMNGLNRFPAGQWVHLGFSFDAATGETATWMNGGPDRRAYNPWRDLARRLTDDDAHPLEFFRNAKGVRVAQVRFHEKPRRLGHVPPLEVLVQELPYRDRIRVHLQHIRDDFPLPVEMVANNGYVSGTAPLESRHLVESREPCSFDLPIHNWRNATSELVLRFYHDGLEVHRYEDTLINPAAASPATWKFLRGAPWTNGPKHPDWWINEDNSISFRGEKVFPLGLYTVKPADLEFVAELGFTMIGLTKPEPEMKANEWRALQETLFEKAAGLGVTLTVTDDADRPERPAQGFLYAFDEPWGHSQTPVRRKYQYLRDARRHSAELPVLGVQNNLQRFRSTAQGTDIFGVDPYAVHGALPLRYVYDTVRMAIRDTDGLMPVQAVIENYGSLPWRTTPQEMRTSSYLAIIAGANALSFYAWDDGAGPSTRELPDHVEAYRSLLAELKTLTPVIATPNLADGPVFEPAAPRGFFGAAKAAEGKTCLFLASDLYTPGTRALVYEAAGDREAKLLFDGDDGAPAALKFTAGRAELSLPPLAAAVYELGEL